MSIQLTNQHGVYRPDHPDRCLRVVLYRVPREAELAVTFQREACGGHHIVRGQSMPGTPFAGQYMTTLTGRTAYSADEMRAETLSYAEQVRRYEERRPDRVVLGFAGAGNITMNPRFMAFDGEAMAYTDPDVGGTFGKPCPALLVWRNGGAELRSDVSFNRVDGKSAVAVSGVDRTTEIASAIQGPQLVENGRPISETQLIKLAADGWFYDLRHILQFPFLTWPPRRPRDERLEIDCGLETFWAGGQLNQTQVRDALSGEEIEIHLDPYLDTVHDYVREVGGGKPVGIDPIEETLRAQGYSDRLPRGERGWFAIDREENTLHMCLRRGIYNHSILGLTEDRELRWLGIAGLGGRVGVTMEQAARLAADNGMDNALLVDNGGDVMLNLRNDWALRSGYGRSRIRGLLLFTIPITPVAFDEAWLPLEPLASRAS